MKIDALKLVMAITFTCYAQGAFAEPVQQMSTLIETVNLTGGTANQGLALGDNYYYGANIDSISRFDKNWNFIETVPVVIPGVDHLGAIDYQDGFIWGGFLDSTQQNDTNGTAIVAKIQTSDLSIVQTWDLTPLGLSVIDPVAFDGEYLWVGQFRDTFNRFRLEDDGTLTPSGILRYSPQLYNFSQGIRIVGDRLYSINTFGQQDGLFEFIIPEDLANQDLTVSPVRRWDIQETAGHLQGFDFVPGNPGQLWEAQGSRVDLYDLEGLGVAVPEPSTSAIMLLGSILALALRCYR